MISSHKTNHEALVDFVLLKAEDAPLAERVRVYRGLAELIGDEELNKQLHSLADTLADADARCREFVFMVADHQTKKPTK
jgi:hypothetical protein